MKAPDFSLPDQNGKTHKLTDAAGTYAVVYFYPKDNTPGCTKEACAFRDAMDRYRKAGVSVYGISKDSVASHERFSEKYDLNFPILSDPDHRAIAAYGAWDDNRHGIKRMSFLVDPDGMIAKTYDRVDPLVHAAEVLADIEQLKGT